MTAKATRYRKGKPGVCKACRRMLVIHGRGLCQTCWRQPNIRNRYKPRKKSSQPEPTIAELEAMIEQQMKELPEWWNTEDRET